MYLYLVVPENKFVRDNYFVKAQTAKSCVSDLSKSNAHCHLPQRVSLSKYRYFKHTIYIGLQG